MNTNGKVKSVLDQKNEYKNTVFGFIPKDWEIVKLKDISIRKGTYGIGAAAVEYNENLPRYLRITDIDDQGRIINEDPKCVDDPDSVNYILKKNDLVFARTGNTTGKTYLYKNEDGVLVYAGFLIKFSINPIKADSRFVKYFTETNYYWQWVGIMSMRSGQPGINENEYSKLTLPLPPLPEQQKISSILSTWDKAIELKEKLIEQKKEQKKGLMQKLLTGEVRLPGFEGEWKEVRLGSILKERKETGFEQLELLAITSQKGVVRRTEVDIKDNSSEDKSKYKRILPNDIGYNTMRMWQGVSGVSEYEGIVSPAYTILKPTDKVYSYFMGYLFKLPTVVNLFKRYSQGLVSDTLNLKYENLKVIKVFIPTDINEQKSIAELFLCIDKEINILQKEVDSFKQQKKGLMQLLLTGKVRVQV